jgi:trimeric autotransporter adhesin
VKKDIRPLSADDALAGIQALKPVTFAFKDPARPAGTQLGFLAQDVRQIYPGLVAMTSNKTPWTPDGTLSLNYSGLIAPIVAAVQKLKADNDNLRARVEQDEREIADLKRTVGAR